VVTARHKPVIYSTPLSNRINRLVAAARVPDAGANEIHCRYNPGEKRGSDVTAFRRKSHMSD